MHYDTINKNTNDTDRRNEKKNKGKRLYLIGASAIGFPLPPWLRGDEATGCSILKRQKVITGEIKILNNSTNSEQVAENCKKRKALNEINN